MGHSLIYPTRKLFHEQNLKTVAQQTRTKFSFWIKTGVVLPSLYFAAQVTQHTDVLYTSHRSCLEQREKEKHRKI